MKPDDVKRSVRVSRYSREPGDAPNLGRVGRMPGFRGTKGTRRKRRMSARDRHGFRKLNNRAVLGWSVLLGSLVLIVLAIALGSWLVPKMRRVAPVAANENLAEKRRVISNFAPPSEAETVALVKAALLVRDPREVKRYFRLGGSTAGEALHFLTTLEADRGTPRGFEWLSSLDANGLALEGVLIKFNPENQKRDPIALLTPNSAGEWQVDFEALSEKATPSWEEFQDGQSDVIRTRIHLAEDNYYNGFFMKDSEWACYAIVVNGIEEIFFGYCRRNSPQADALKWIFSQEGKLKRVTLELRREKGARSRQFEITQIIANDWVATEAPFDVRFNW